MAAEEDPVMVPLNAALNEVTEIQSLCMYCHEQGMTRLLMTVIPFFREVVISSFSCDHCGYEDKELMPATEIRERGLKVELKVSTPQDLNRQIVLTKSASIAIPEVDLEIPPAKGILTTVEGVLQKTIDELQFNQEARRLANPETAEKIDEFIAKLEDLRKLEKPFTLKLMDPTGNSFVENPIAPKTDHAMTVVHYKRSKEDDEILGIVSAQVAEPVEPVERPEEVVEFEVNCPNCKALCQTKMKKVDIPHFKEVILMSTTCETCGCRDNEVRGGGGMSDKGTKITLKMTDPTDLARDILLSETGSLAIPELEFVTEGGTLGGRFTSIEGILVNIREQLEVSNPFSMGDSDAGARKGNLMDFCDTLNKVIKGEKLDIHIILDDPAGNSYLQNTYAPDQDPEMTVEEYERTDAQDDELGIKHMNTENQQS